MFYQTNFSKLIITWSILFKVICFGFVLPINFGNIAKMLQLNGISHKRHKGRRETDNIIPDKIESVINENIIADKVRLLVPDNSSNSTDGVMFGVVSISNALERARAYGLDLILV
jgi:hypothetical protein